MLAFFINDYFAIISIMRATQPISARNNDVRVRTTARTTKSAKRNDARAAIITK